MKSGRIRGGTENFVDRSNLLYTTRIPSPQPDAFTWGGIGRNSPGGEISVLRVSILGWGQGAGSWRLRGTGDLLRKVTPPHLRRRAHGREFLLLGRHWKLHSAEYIPGSRRWNGINTAPPPAPAVGLKGEWRHLLK